MVNNGGTHTERLQALRARVDEECNELSRAFDRALSDPFARNLDELGGAADRLMRAGAAILLALGHVSDER